MIEFKHIIILVSLLHFCVTINIKKCFDLILFKAFISFKMWIYKKDKAKVVDEQCLRWW